MPKQRLISSDNLLGALTQQEIAQLVDVLFEVLTPELQKQAIDLLPPNTQQTIRQLIALPQIHKPNSTKHTFTTSLAKQNQIWAKLWQNWDAIIEEAAQEDGKYIIQDAHWETPYFDTPTFIEDLEQIANQMRPLIPTAFEQQFTPTGDFITALLEAETDVSGGIPDWVELTEGFCLEPQLTYCALEWEWLLVQDRGQDAFHFAQEIFQYEQQFQEVNFDSNILLDFLTKLSEADQRNILAGLTSNQETSIWQRGLESTNSHWHLLYLWLIEKYTPDRYVGKLRETIPQQWQNGLPVIEALLTEHNYDESLVIIEEIFQSLLKHKLANISWTPETALLITTLNFHGSEQENASTLLGYYQQTVQELNQMERANALAIQQIAIKQWLKWSNMFTAFGDIPVSAATRQALFISWRDFIDRQSKPSGWRGYGTVQTVDSWWVPWLIDSVADPQKGARWFQSQITQWIINLPGDKIQLGENYDLLRLLTKDLTEIQGQSSYVRFYQVVIRPQEFFTRNDNGQGDRSRREYLKLFAPDDLLTQVMNYWKTHLQQFVPKPELAQKSDYTEHARWIMALEELSPPDYHSLLSQWQVIHQRRSNLWKAIEKIGLE